MCLVTKCGTFTVKVSTAASDTHTAGTETSPTLTVNKANDTATAPTAKTVTYYGSAQELVNAGSTNDGTLYCAVTTENKAPTDESLYTTSIPAKTEAGTYYVWYRVGGDDNHNNYGPYPVAVTILNAKVAPKAPTGESLTYNGKDQLLVKAGSVTVTAVDQTITEGDAIETGVKRAKLSGMVKGHALNAVTLTAGDGKITASGAKIADADGKKTYIGKASPQVHAVTGGYTNHECNTRSVKLNKTRLTLKAGRSATLKAKLKGVKSGMKLVDHVAKVRFYSTDANVATVDAKGNVKAVAKGSCTIYAIANNGVRSKVKVNVK